MSEIKTNKRVAKIMPGFDRKNGDLKAYDLQNTIVLGVTDSGVGNILNNTLLNLIQYNSPNDVCIQYYSDSMEAPWLNKNRQIPHFVNQSYPQFSKEGNYDSLLIELTRCLRAMEGSYEEGMLCGRNNVIVIEVTSGMWSNEYVRLAISLLARRTADRSDVHLILATSSNLSGLTELENYFGLRIITRTNDEMSNKFLGCNLASIEEEKYGFAWITEKSNFYTKTRLDVPYKPESLIRKVCKYLSNDTNPMYDAYRVEWEYTTKDDELNDHFNLRARAISWRVTPIDDAREYGRKIKYYNEVQLCIEYLKGMDEHSPEPGWSDLELNYLEKCCYKSNHRGGADNE